MKATGIVRRIDVGVIITPKPKKPHKYWFSLIFVQLNLQKNRLNWFFEQKSEV